MSSSKLKTLYLLDILMEQSDEAHRLSVPDMITELSKKGIEAERKSIYRDLEALEEYGVDIVKTGTGYYVGRRELDVGEIKVLTSAVQAANFISEERSKTLIEKLLNHTSTHYREELISQMNMGAVKCENDEVMMTIETLNLAIAMKRQITFSYYKRDINRKSVVQRNGRKYRVSPYAMIWMQDRYYLVGNMEERNDLTHFRLDRIKNARLDIQPWRHFSEVSPYRTKFDQADYAKKCVNMFGDGVRLVTIRCENSLADDIFDKFGEGVIVSHDGQDYFKAFIDVASGDGFLAWVSQFADRIEILAPEEVREAMRDRVKRVNSLYDKKGN